MPTGILTLTAPQTYTGTTNVIGGTLTLADDATLASTTINVNYATLALSDTGVANIGIPGNANRISDAATVTLRGGSLTLAPLGGVSFATTETIGTVAAAQGANTLGTTLATSASYLTIGNLTRATGATLNSTTNAGTLGAATANDPKVLPQSDQWRGSDQPAVPRCRRDRKFDGLRCLQRDHRRRGIWHRRSPCLHHSSHRGGERRPCCRHLCHRQS